MTTLKIKEGHFGSDQFTESTIQLPKNKKITLAELIQLKVAAKTIQINEEIAAGTFGTTHLTQKEKILNKVHLQKKQELAKIDAEKSGYDALAAFQANAFFVLINEEQKTELTEVLELTTTTKVQFIRLVPLVGG